MKLLNVGCGSRYREGWTNIDQHPNNTAKVMACDLSKGIPFEKETFDVVYHSHVLEHFDKEHAKFFLRDCMRVLKIGGILRVVVPDLETIARNYLNQLNEAIEQPESELAAANHEWMVIMLIDQCTRHASGGEMSKFLRQCPVNTDFATEQCGALIQQVLDSVKGEQPNEKTEMSNDLPWRQRLLMSEQDREALTIGRFRMSGEPHRWMYDRFSLSRILKELGFSNITIQTAHQSFVANWRDYHLDTEPDGSVYKPESLFMEGLKA